MKEEEIARTAFYEGEMEKIVKVEYTKREETECEVNVLRMEVKDM
jgi:hypothetical protein